jgi:hypothetical protein
MVVCVNDERAINDEELIEENQPATINRRES